MDDRIIVTQNTYGANRDTVFSYSAAAADELPEGMETRLAALMLLAQRRNATLGVHRARLQLCL